MTEKEGLPRRRPNIAPTVVRPARLLIADAAEVDRMVEYERGRDASPCSVIRELVHVVLRARLPLAQAIDALRAAEAEKRDPSPLRRGWDLDRDPPVVEALLELYTDLVLGLAPAVTRPPVPPEKAAAFAALDQETTVRRRADAEAALRLDLGQPPLPTTDKALGALAAAMTKAEVIEDLDVPWLGDDHTSALRSLD